MQLLRLGNKPLNANSLLKTDHSQIQNRPLRVNCLIQTGPLPVKANINFFMVHSLPRLGDRTVDHP
jgi:hypothetical protein